MNKDGEMDERVKRVEGQKMDAAMKVDEVKNMEGSVKMDGKMRNLDDLSKTASMDMVAINNLVCIDGNMSI